MFRFQLRDLELVQAGILLNFEVFYCGTTVGAGSPEAKKPMYFLSYQNHPKWQ